MISVVIPTLDEARCLAATIARLQSGAGRREIVVVDGGSSDNTVEIARAAGCKVILSPEPHRARQMNRGAAGASGEILLFLHADTLVPDIGLVRIEEALRNPRVIGGGFARRFDSGSFFLKATCLLAECRSLWLGWFLGDQGIFVRRSVFEAERGFRELALFEDLEFSRRLARQGCLVTLRPPVLSSARRFVARGPVLTTCADFWLVCRYLLGADADALAESRAIRTRKAKETTGSIRAS